MRSKSSKRRSAPSSKWAAFTHRVDVYARRVCGDQSAGLPIVVGPYVRLACARHLDDRVLAERGHPDGYRFDADRADHIIRFFEDVLKLPDMLDADGQPLPFKLELWQAFIVGSLFGWYTREGYRRFREAYIEIGKGNGKTPLCAGIGLYGLFMDGERAAEVYAAASDQTQAQTLFRYAVNMVRVSPGLDEALHLAGGNEIWKIEHHTSLSFFRTFSRESGAKSGPIPHMGLLDELHEHGSSQISIKIRAGAKRRKNALFLEITNSGFDRTSICWEHHEHSRKVVEGTIPDPQWFAYVCALDAKDDPLTTEDCWPKVNPNLGVSIGWEYLRRQVSNARHMPSETNTVLRLNFCVWTHAETRYFDMEKWRACKVVVDDDDLIGVPCYGGIDLGQTDDFSAWARIWVKDDGKKVLRVRFWLPEAALRKYPNRPYDAWQRAGLIEVTPGETTDEELIEEAILEDARSSGVLEIGYDKRFASGVEKHLTGAGLKMVDTPQGFALNEPIRKFNEWVISGDLEHEGNPILEWMAANAVVKPGRDNVIRLDKESSSEKIDGIVAAVIAAFRVIAAMQEPVPQYQAYVFGGHL